jgi:hypothetical protein
MLRPHITLSAFPASTCWCQAESRVQQVLVIPSHPGHDHVPGAVVVVVVDLGSGIAGSVRGYVC